MYRFAEEELQEDSVIKDTLITAAEGKHCKTKRMRSAHLNFLKDAGKFQQILLMNL
jgi:hypothetical protein